MTPAGATFITLSIIVLAVEIWLAYVSWHFRPKYSKVCKGFLRNQKHRKNVRIRYYRSTDYIKDLMDFVYAYRVDGVEYFIKGDMLGKERDLPKIVDIVYQVNKPKRAYIKTKNLSDNIYFAAFIILLPFLILFLIFGIIWW